jgi:hypothetical protein
MKPGYEETSKKLNHHILENLKSCNLRTKISSEGKIQDDRKYIELKNV